MKNTGIKEKSPPSPKSCAHSSLCFNAFMEKGARMGEVSHLEKLPFIPLGEAQSTAERREAVGCSHFEKRCPPPCRDPSKLGPWQQPLK